MPSAERIPFSHINNKQQIARTDKKEAHTCSKHFLHIYKKQQIAKTDKKEAHTCSQIIPKPLSETAANTFKT